MMLEFAFTSHALRFLRTEEARYPGVRGTQLPIHVSM